MDQPKIDSENICSYEPLCDFVQSWVSKNSYRTHWTTKCSIKDIFKSAWRKQSCVLYPKKEILSSVTKRCFRILSLYYIIDILPYFLLNFLCVCTKLEFGNTMIFFLESFNMFKCTQLEWEPKHAKYTYMSSTTTSRVRFRNMLLIVSKQIVTKGTAIELTIIHSSQACSSTPQQC